MHVSACLAEWLRRALGVQQPAVVVQVVDLEKHLVYHGVFWNAVQVKECALSRLKPPWVLPGVDVRKSCPHCDPDPLSGLDHTCLLCCVTLQPMPCKNKWFCEVADPCCSRISRWVAPCALRRSSEGEVCVLCRYLGLCSERLQTTLRDVERHAQVR